MTLNLKDFFLKRVKVKPPCTLFICSPIKSKQFNSLKTQFEYLEDLNFAASGLKNDIYLLIRSSHDWSIVTEKVKLGETTEPIAVATKCGWIINGPMT